MRVPNRTFYLSMVLLLMAIGCMSYASYADSHYHGFLALAAFFLWSAIGVVAKNEQFHYDLLNNLEGLEQCGCGKFFDTEDGGPCHCTECMVCPDCVVVDNCDYCKDFFESDQVNKEP